MVFTFVKIFNQKEYMKKYEAVIILNPNLSSKVDAFLKDFEKLLGESSFSILKVEDIGRRQLSYSINNHNCLLYTSPSPRD